MERGHEHGKKRRAHDDTEGEQRLAKQLKTLHIHHAPPRPHLGSHKYQSYSTEYMTVDETKERVVIHDLDSEIADIEADEPKQFLLPEIDKKFSAIPQMLLRNQSEAANTQLVLYQVPSSISVPQEQDSVRKAIIDARHRVIEKQAQEIELRNGYANGAVAGNHKGFAQIETPQDMYDPDAMDIS